MNTELIKLLIYKDYFIDFYYIDYETFINKIKELKDCIMTIQRTGKIENT